MRSQDLQVRTEYCSWVNKSNSIYCCLLLAHFPDPIFGGPVAGLDLESVDPSGFFREENADGAGLAGPESKFTLDPRAEFN